MADEPPRQPTEPEQHALLEAEIGRIYPVIMPLIMSVDLRVKQAFMGGLSAGLAIHALNTPGGSPAAVINTILGAIGLPGRAVDLPEPASLLAVQPPAGNA